MPNRLAQTQSLYLRKHAENPIDWWPWQEEALTRARMENRPIFLSIGYSSCHWCTVMEGEAFSDQAIADYMNAHFLPIKVDREERPDLDSLYMQALQMMRGQGGWPLNLFLEPKSLVPFYGGTYFPLGPAYGQPGFLQLLQTVRHFYDHEPEKLSAIKTEILDALERSGDLQTQEPVLDLANGFLPRGLMASARLLTPVGERNRFPMIPHAQAALQGFMRAVEAEDVSRLWQITQQRGLDLVLGGIFDHVGGGFHRYTVDPTWTVPHFEKMLYDNGQIVEYLAHLWGMGMQESALERAIDRTISWLQREMQDPDGGFYAAQDADSFLDAADEDAAGSEANEPEEGAFYVWTYEELGQILGETTLKALEEAFDIRPAGNFEGRTVLQRRQGGDLTETVEQALGQLFYVRYGTVNQRAPFSVPPDGEAARHRVWPGRIPPVTDTKMIVAWNALMISGLARAAQMLGKADYLQLAAHTALNLLSRQRVDDHLCRLRYEGIPSGPAQAEDYALLIKALLDVQQATLGLSAEASSAGASSIGASAALPDGADWLLKAREIQAEFDRWLWSDERGGYCNTAADASAYLLVRERSFQDGATPAANGVAIANLMRLFLLIAEPAYRERAEKGLRAFSGVMEKYPRACPSLFEGLGWLHHGTVVHTLGDYLPLLMNRYWPYAAFIAANPQSLPTGASGLVCQGTACLEPASSLEELQTQLQRTQRVSESAGSSEFSSLAGPNIET